MNNTVLRIISAILALGAIAVAFFAIRLSQAPAPVPVTQKASEPVIPVEAVATTTKPLRAGQVIVAGDVAVKRTTQAPAQAYRQVQEVVGRVPIADIPAGTTLTPSLFAADSIAYLLKPNERAVAIQVDEVASVGGFIKPGDRVDVLSFIAQTNDTQSTAQVVVDNVKLLTVGNVTQLDEIEKVQSDQDSLIKPISGTTNVKSGNVDERRLRMRSAVVAVLERDVNKLMLAANSGLLRLALRPPVGSNPNDVLDQSRGKGLTVTRPGAATLKELTLPKDGSSSRKLVVQEGSKEREVSDETKAPR